MKKRILDVCCGERSFYYDKNNPLVHFCDIRKGKYRLADGRIVNVNPDIVCDFKWLPFQNDTYDLVVFDPPHLIHTGENSIMTTRYGRLDAKYWRSELKQGFDECMRVLKPNGILIFKWNTHDVKVREVLIALDYEPIFGHMTRSNKRSSTHWFCFMKTANNPGIKYGYS